MNKLNLFKSVLYSMAGAMAFATPLLADGATGTSTVSCEPAQVPYYRSMGDRDVRRGTVTVCADKNAPNRRIVLEEEVCFDAESQIFVLCLDTPEGKAKIKAQRAALREMQQNAAFADEIFNKRPAAPRAPGAHER